MLYIHHTKLYIIIQVFYASHTIKFLNIFSCVKQANHFTLRRPQNIGKIFHKNNFKYIHFEDFISDFFLDSYLVKLLLIHDICNY